MQYSLFSFSLYVLLQSCALGGVFIYHTFLHGKDYSIVETCFYLVRVNLEDVRHQVGNPHHHTILVLNLRALHGDFRRNRSCPGKSI